ncbi:MAG: hypothetical protein WCT14_14905 [Treponemataceae bacterium]
MTHRNTRDGIIVDPRAFLHSASPSSPLWALIDSFDAATNGMTNTEAAARFAETEEEAFLPWKGLVAAIRAFYAEDAAGLIDALDRIPDSSPPAVLKPLFRAWALSPDVTAAESLAEAPAAIATLYRRVLTEVHPAAAFAEQAEEALRQGMIEHFETLACRTIRELHDATRSDGPLLSLRCVARFLALIDEAGEEDGAFFSAILKTIGRADGLTALGLALIDRDDEAAAAAFRGALASKGTGCFVDTEMQSVLTAVVDILEKQLPIADTRKVVRAVKRRATPNIPGQLDLFPQEAV